MGESNRSFAPHDDAPVGLVSTQVLAACAAIARAEEQFKLAQAAGSSLILDQADERLKSAWANLEILLEQGA